MEPLRRLFGSLFGRDNEQRKSKRKHNGRMVKSYVPKVEKERRVKTKRPRKPVPNGRAELVARQKKARP